ncbi:hypothetical protein ACK8P5_10590 [Paenibacillus sp. EC2-1]|uniref:hypothetical protein n=1 Tax=Paenibacillus sp. EC2-1 TaxID=3388665 RepID=UPI003BEF1E09
MAMFIFLWIFPSMQLVKNYGYQLKPRMSILYIGVYLSVLSVQRGFFTSMLLFSRHILTRHRICRQTCLKAESEPMVHSLPFFVARGCFRNV